MTTRVVVCFTGGVGSQAIRLLSADPGYEVVGVLVHHEDKVGKDIGELVGIEPTGVTATRDVDALVALRADGALWHSLSFDPQVVAKFLAAGTNVYSSIGGWYPPGLPEHELLSTAAQTGGATFVAGGNIPGLISDVLPLFVSGYSSQVRLIRAWQSDYVPNYPSALQLELGLGIGVPPDTSGELSDVDKQWLWGIGESAKIVADGLGLPLTDVRLTNKEFANTPEDMELSPSGYRVAAGTPAGVRWTFTAFTTDDVPFFELVNEQTVRLGLGEGWRASGDEPNWRVEVVGTPTLTCVVDLPHDHSDGLDPVSALNAARGVNFLPRLIAAEPGLCTVLDLPAPRAATLRLGGSA